MEAKIEALEEKFKSLVSSCQILDSPSSTEARASSSTPDYYMFGTSGEVVSSVSATRAQAVSQATPSTIGKLVANLQTRDNAPADQIGQARLPLSFGLADAIQSVSGCYPNEVPNLAIDMTHTPLFTAIDWSPPKFQPAKVFHLADKILEGKASLPSLTVAQATTDILASEDLEGVAK